MATAAAEVGLDAPGEQRVPASTMGEELDASRAYVSGSLWDGFGRGDGTFSDGPYGIQDPEAFFVPCAAIPQWAFNPEVLAGTPPALH